MSKTSSSLVVRLSDLSFLLYFCVIFAHQRETMIDTMLRYGSIALVVFCWVLPKLADPKRRGHLVWRIHLYEYWQILFVVYAALSVLWCIDMGKTYSILFELLKVMIVCFILTQRLTSEKEVDRLLGLLWLALCYMLAVILLRTPLSAFGTERLGEVVGLHSNEIGRLCGLASLLCFYFGRKYSRYLLFFLASMAVFSAAGLFTGSKNAILILVFQLGLFWLLVSKRWKRMIVYLLIAVGVVFIYQLIMTNEFLYAFIGQRVERMVLTLTGAGYDGSTYERLYFMRTAWQLFLKHPVFGVGLNNFAAYLSVIGYHNAVYSHCGFLELLSTLGVIGCLIYYSMYLYVLGGLVKSAFEHHPLSALLFVIILRIFVFDMTSLSVYTYNSYILLAAAYSWMRCMLVGQKVGERL